VIASGLIVIADYDYIRAAQDFSVIQAPLVRAAGIRGRGEPKFAKGVSVLLALNNVDDFRSLDRGS
jgi:hypothetical protein